MTMLLPKRKARESLRKVLKNNKVTFFFITFAKNMTIWITIINGMNYP